MNAAVSLPDMVADPDWDFLGVMLVIVTGLCVTGFASGWLIGRLALAAFRRLAGGGDDTRFLSAKIVTARFYADHFLALAPGYLPAIRGAAAVLDFDPEQF